MQRVDIRNLQNDVTSFVERAMATDRIVNVPLIAETLRQQYEHLNIALEDIEALVLQSALTSTIPIEFDRAHAGTKSRQR